MNISDKVVLLFIVVVNSVVVHNRCKQKDQEGKREQALLSFFKEHPYESHMDNKQRFEHGCYRVTDWG
jgi:hypothetical protein